MKLTFLPFPIATLLSVGWASAASVVGTNHMSGFEEEGLNIFNLAEEFASETGGAPENTSFLFLHVSGNSYTYGGSALDDGVSLFFVDRNDEFSEEKILGDDFVELEFNELYSLPTNFFIGLRTPHLDVLPVADFRFPPAYGWAEIHNDGLGELSLVDHAIAYGSQGIFVDTTNSIPIPESDSVALMFSAAFLCLKGRCRNNWRLSL